VEEHGEGSAVDFQRPRRDARQLADVSRRLQARLLRPIPASGYHEWKPVPSGKRPYYIIVAGRLALSMAGLWDQWTDIYAGVRALMHDQSVTAA
jgi:SOS response associated peptidase (SRAP)